MNVIRPLLLCCLGASPLHAQTVSDWSGNISLQARLFPEETLHQGQKRNNLSVSVDPEYYLDWNGGQQRVVFHPFFRYDASDDERTHADMIELYWRGSYGDFEITAGVAKVFWGVAESQHLVDIINQTDFIENIDGEDKLGQPMVNLRFIKDWGTLDFYILPYFRERTFPGEEGRLRSALVVDTDNPVFESGAQERHTDWAVRWAHVIGDWDIGVAHFSGTSREPVLLPAMVGGNLVLTPYYQQIDQTSLDLQATKGDWLWKLEAISNSNDIEDYFAAVGGFEYTLVGVFDSATDLGLLLEYHYDDRDDNATTGLEDDTFIGTRWVFNDSASTAILAGVIVDNDSSSTFGNIEASRRFAKTWKIVLEARIFSNIDPSEVLFDFRDDDYLELQAVRYF